MSQFHPEYSLERNWRSRRSCDQVRITTCENLATPARRNPREHLSRDCSSPKRARGSSPDLVKTAHRRLKRSILISPPQFHTSGSTSAPMILQTNIPKNLKERSRTEVQNEDRKERSGAPIRHLSPFFLAKCPRRRALRGF